MITILELAIFDVNNFLSAFRKKKENDDLDDWTKKFDLKIMRISCLKIQKNGKTFSFLIVLTVSKAGYDDF